MKYIKNTYEKCTKISCKVVIVNEAAEMKHFNVPHIEVPKRFLTFKGRPVQKKRQSSRRNKKFIQHLQIQYQTQTISSYTKTRESSKVTEELTLSSEQGSTDIETFKHTRTHHLSVSYPVTSTNSDVDVQFTLQTRRSLLHDGIHCKYMAFDECATRLVQDYDTARLLLEDINSIPIFHIQL